MKSSQKRKTRATSFLGELGSSLVETAIVIPVALITACGVVALGFGLDALFTLNRISFELVSLMSFTNMSSGTNTTVGHAKVHARAAELVDLQPKGFASTPVINTTFTQASVQIPDDGDDSDDAIIIGHGPKIPKPKVPTYNGARVTATVDANFPRFFQRFNIAIQAKYVGPYNVTTPTASGSVDFINPLPLVDCEGVSGGAESSPCGYN